MAGVLDVRGHRIVAKDRELLPDFRRSFAAKLDILRWRIAVVRRRDLRLGAGQR
jgi:hypothetical protein